MLPPPPVLAAAPVSSGGGDKYSALRDLLEDDFSVKTETVSSPECLLPPQTKTPLDLSQTLLQPPVIAPSQPLSQQPRNDFDEEGGQQQEKEEQLPQVVC